MEAEQPRTVRQVRDLIAWIGTGRKLTQTGKVTLADARALVALLETGDTVDPSIGDRTFKTKTSQELYHLNLLVEWAKSARLLRTASGRVVPVKKNARVLEDPELLVQALFDALPRIGDAVLPAGWLGSPFAEEYPAGLRALLAHLYASDHLIPEQDLQAAVWDNVSGFFILDDLSADRLRLLRQSNNRDVTLLLATLDGLGALQRTGDTASLTAAGRRHGPTARRAPPR